ncbi:hypothetical protein, conserved [Leishmania tarentolae]|uniref:C2 domain-containing protein n=1 Tax=Leishmania tarentolae TaxID=5689 RepID=A0A640KUE2_LEITA|nr:hypothetical protein, conserved [Leishmania tarentolae]
MSSTGGVDLSGREVQERLPPGVYRVPYTAPLTHTHADTDCASTAAKPPKDATKSLSDVRSRFHQLRDLRRELSGRPLPNSHAFSTAAASGANASSVFPATLPTTTLAQAPLSVTLIPSATSFALPLDRLSPEDPVTRLMLRTAAAERALRLQQTENDELKRARVMQQQEAVQMQCLIDCLSSELTEMRQTVLRQTAVMKSLASEMDRQDAYHLIKEKHRSQIGAAAVTANALPGTLSSQSSSNHQQRLAEIEQQLEQLTTEKAELQQRVSHLCAGHSGKQKSTPAIEVIDKDDEVTEEASVADRLSSSACMELQKLVRSLGEILRAGASPRACMDASCEPVYELELSSVTRLTSLRTRRKLNDSALAPAKVNPVICIYGPYNMQDVLLRVEPATENAGSLMRRYRRLEEVPGQSSNRCVLYAVRDTRTAVRFCLYEGAAKAEVETGESGDTQCLAPAATATVAVHTLIATALASSHEVEAIHASCNVHTVHLADDKGTPRDTVTFRVRVSEVPHRRYLDYRGMGGIGSDLEGRRRTSPFPSPLRLESGEIRIHERHASSSSSAAVGQGVGEGVAKNLYCGQGRGPMLSPLRDDDSTPTERQRLFAHSLSSCSTAPPAPTDDAASRDSPEDAESILEVKLQPKPLSELPMPSEDSKNSIICTATACSSTETKTCAATSKSSESFATDDSTSKAAKTATVLPLHGAAVPISPRVTESSDSASTVGVHPSPSTSRPSWPPPPPVVVVPAPPMSSTPTTAPPTSVTCATWMYIKEVRSLHEGCDDDVVEDMLERCSLQVVVRVDGEPVFTAPTRRNSAHAVWNAEEGSFTCTLTTGQEMRFEVLDGDTARSQGVLPVSEILKASGERDVSLVPINGGRPCGQLTMVFKGSV